MLRGRPPLVAPLSTVQTGTGKVDPARKFICTTAARDIYSFCRSDRTLRKCKLCLNEKNQDGMWIKQSFSGQNLLNNLLRRLLLNTEQVQLRRIIDVVLPEQPEWPKSVLLIIQLQINQSTEEGNPLRSHEPLLCRHEPPRFAIQTKPPLCRPSLRYADRASALP